MQIGKLMKSGQAEEAEAIKQEVEKANDVADSAEEAFEKVRLDSGATHPVYSNPKIHVPSQLSSLCIKDDRVKQTLTLEFSQI